ncbi:MAG: toprim domain-containing protein [Selenomonadaceae bacterium]|nr:toprim domain-containing protein [Selenomonadaceae bacterium]
MLSKEEREKIRTAVRMVDPDTVAIKIGLVKAKLGWTCPECNNGSGHDGTGIVPKYLSQNGDHVEWHCYKCHCSWDNIALAAKFKLNYHVDDKGKFPDANDFPKALEAVAKLLGVVIDENGEVHSPHAASPVIFDDTNEVDESKLKDYSNFYSFAASGLKFFMARHDNVYRGIPKAIYEYFWCGHVGEFGKAKTPAFIVPASKHSFLARFTGNEDELSDEQKSVLRKKWHSPAPKPVFNFKRAVESDDPIIFVHEGEFDAISTFFGSVRDEFINANGIISLSKTPHVNAVAIMGTAITGKHKRRLRAEDIGKKFFVVVLDNDEAGIKETPAVVKTLKALGHDAVGVQLSDKFNDANEFLQAEPENFAARIKEIYDAAKNGTLTDDEIFSAPANDEHTEINAQESAEETETPAPDNSVDEQKPDFSDYESVHGKINPDIKAALAEGISFAKTIGEENFDVKELSTIKRRHQIAALKVYMSRLHDEFIATLKKICKEAKKICRELEKEEFFSATSTWKGNDNSQKVQPVFSSFSSANDDENNSQKVQPVFSSFSSANDDENNSQKVQPVFSSFSSANALADFDVKNFQHEVNELAREIKKKQTAYNAQQLREHERARDKAAIDNKFKIKADNFDVEYLFAQPDDDEGRATQLIYTFGSCLRHITARDQWLVFQKNPDYKGCGVWTLSNPKQDIEVLRFARKMSSILTANMPANADKDTDKMIQSWRNGKCMSNAIRLARVDDQVVIKAADLDAHPNLLLVKNGVIDLQTKQFYPEVDKNLLLTKCCNAVWNPNADQSTVRKFLRDIQPNEESLAAMIRYLGYCTTGEINQQKLHFWKGRGANGKSTILVTYKYMMGGHAVNIPASLLLEPKTPADANNATPALAMLIGARVAISSELPQTCTLNSQLVKDVTGGEEMSVRLLHCNFENFRPFAKFIICGNFFPQLANVRDKGLLRRLQTLEFSQTFEGKDADLSLPKRLLEEENLSALLSVIVDGAYNYYREDKLIESAEMNKSRRTYIADNDFITQFIEEFCVTGDDKHCTRKDFLDKLRNNFGFECSRYNDRELGKLVEQLPNCRRERTKRGIEYFGFGLVDNSHTDDIPFES